METPQKLSLAACVAAICAFSTPLGAQTPISIPDIDGYLTLQCDFHMHTVFSDGLVWPTVRVDEASREGLDAIALTEHIEYRPHSEDIVAAHDRSYDIIKPMADGRGMLAIRGSEITRQMPPGHFNAIFLEDSDVLEQKEWRDAFAEARKQNAFIFWNHPSFPQQEHETRWFPEHEEIYQNGWMDGIEVANGSGEYVHEAHQWCIDKNLTMIGTTDIHNPIQTDVDYAHGEHRVMTLVFARERTVEGIREALDARRTAVFTDDRLIGSEDLLNALLTSSVKIDDVKTEARRVTVTWTNDSDLTFRLRKTEHDPEIDYLRDNELTVGPRSSGTFVVRFPEGKRGKVNFEVTNLLVAPGKGLDVSYDLP